MINQQYINDEQKYNDILRCLDEYISDNLFDYKIKKKNNNVKINKTIWTMWFQGLEAAPLLVKRCAESVKENKPKDFDYVLIDENNISEYIDIPDSIIKKVIAGSISMAHFSDLIRLELLCTYGGCWIDATVFCMDCIPVFMLDGELFVFRIDSVITDPVIKISNWWIYARQNNKALVGVRNILHNYWEKENVAKDYFLFHVCFTKIIEIDSECKAIYNSIAYFNSGNAHVLHSNLVTTYNDTVWHRICVTSPVQKLSHKIRYIVGDNNSYYEKIVFGKG